MSVLKSIESPETQAYVMIYLLTNEHISKNRYCNPHLSHI